MHPQVTAPGRRVLGSECTSVSDANDGASSASTHIVPSVDVRTGGSGGSAKRKAGAQQRSGASIAKPGGGIAHKVVAQASVTALSKPAPPTMTLRVRGRCGKKRLR